MVDLSHNLTQREISPEDVASVRTDDLRAARSRFGYSPETGLVLLTRPDANPKSAKGLTTGYYEAMLMLHADRLEVNVSSLPTMRPEFESVVTCAHATHGPNGCVETCLMYSGRGRGDPSKNTAIAGRAKRTRWLFDEPHSFLAQLIREINFQIGKADQKGLTPAFRLNGTSDLRWERIVPWFMDELFDPTKVVFLDYTKWPLRARTPRPSNYHIAKSVQASHHSPEDVKEFLQDGHVSMICDDPSLLYEAYPHVYVDADESDFWMVEPRELNVIGLLKPKPPLTKTHPQVFQARDLYYFEMR